MPNIRGFVQKIEAGRAGLVRVTLVEADGSSSDYIVRDIDGDPERFNERLTKIGLMRDAMNRAEPVFIEYTDFKEDEGEGREIQTAARISRDELDSPGEMEQIAGLVVDLTVLSWNGVTPDDRERHDAAKIELVKTDMQMDQVILDLQVPERLVASQQLEMVRESQSQGRLVRFVVGKGRKGEKLVHAVAADNNPNAFGSGRARELDGFVESLSLIRAPFASSPGASPTSSFAHVRFTTAPPFIGAGNTIGLSPFEPVTVDLFVPKGSLSYELFKAGLRDNLRMRVSAVLIKEKQDSDEEKREPGHSDNNIDKLSDSVMETRYSIGKTGGVDAVNKMQKDTVGLVFCAELLAHLASASRPVWVSISRETLDHGPEEVACVDGVPSSDLTPQTLRDLRIPYPAAWIGLGCFNPGIYRFQFKLPGAFTVSVDNEELCLHDSDAEGVHFAHACLGGDHEVEVKLDAWNCDDEFVMDIYQIR